MVSQQHVRGKKAAIAAALKNEIEDEDNDEVAEQGDDDVLKLPLYPENRLMWWKPAPKVRGAADLPGEQGEILLILYLTSDLPIVKKFFIKLSCPLANYICEQEGQTKKHFCIYNNSYDSFNHVEKKMQNRKEPILKY